MIKASNIFRGTAAASIAIALSGCGYLFGDGGMFPDRSQDYKNAEEQPVISVPEGKDTQNLQEIYPIPEVEQDVVLAGDFEVPRPTPLVAGSSDQLVRIQRLGAEQWALVAEAPGEVWPQVRSFLTSAGISVARVDARAGLMETGWMELESQPIASRFRIRIDQGVQRGTSELHVLQMIQAGDIENWPATSDNPEQESEMLSAVAQYIANAAGSAQVSMVANQTISASGKIAMAETAAGEPYIALELPYDRAWASLGRAIEKSTFEIADRDRSSGDYFAVFLGLTAEEEAGWFDWLWDSEAEQPHVGETFVISMRREDEENMAIFLRPQESKVNLTKREQQAMLTLIKGNIN
ncbi:outer membrane protein assembly factor BamC [Halioglobus maricola]|uniref:Outer membrane protein assembly factor BamC n=1 Tax=Halioglobus maricola TaxID=2601894 RepID=A0A5P9NGI9_9GAMM|nr:outer membrane protein assembly factor BamC [Halioglobus maricola]QFU74923.1 outer membrane protein assembly factor BamC [Halioglobus maricola]